MSAPVLKVRINEAGFGSVTLDGREVEQVTAIRIGSRAGELTRVHLEMFCEVDAEMPAHVEVLPLGACL